MSELKQFYYKKNRFQQLKGFYYTAQIGNLTKVAKKMGLTQSTITLQIQSLERDLGVKLFNRDSKSMKLTNDGEILYNMASAHLQAIDSIYENFLHKKEDYKPLRINIAVHHVAISYLLPKYIKEFSKKHPAVTIGIQNISFQDASKRLMDNEIDLMIYPNIDISNEFNVQDLCSFNPILIMTKDHPLAQKKGDIELEDIKNHNVVRIDKDLIRLPLFEAVFKQFEYKTNIDFENANWEIIKHYVKNGIGLGFVSTICIDKNDNDLICKDLSKYFPIMTYKLISKKGAILDNIMKDFIQIINDINSNKGTLFEKSLDKK